MMVSVKRVETTYLGQSDNLSRLCHLSKNLFNEANYIIRQEFLSNGKWIRNNEIDKILKSSENSKCSFLDNEPLKRNTKYLGKRIKRGLFQSLNGTIINADLNGAYNIIKKVFPNAFADGIEGLGVTPRRLSV
jgi:putative transposase